MRVLFLSLALIAPLLTGLAVAEDSFDVSQKDVGAVTRWQANNGRISVTYLGPDGPLHKFRFRRDGSKGSPLTLLSWSTRNGDTVRAQIGRDTVTFDPHDCSLTLGRCSYLATHSRDGKRQVFQQMTRRKGVWFYQKSARSKDKDFVFEEGKFTVDAFGYTINREYRTFDESGKASRGWMKRVD